MKYMIHTYKDRLWYVNEYLVPSLLKQGISIDNIIVYADMNKDGNLVSFLKSIDVLSDDDVDVWHLQDDVLVCSDFRVRAEQEYKTELVCGFASVYDNFSKTGIQYELKDIWFSFPCIRIRTGLLKHFKIWFDSYVGSDARFNTWVETNKHDDLLFRYFLENYHTEIRATNLVPNLVEHIDWLIGGSLVNQIRSDDARSRYWNEKNLVEELEKSLQKRVDKR